MDLGFRRGDTGKSSAAGVPFHVLWDGAVGRNSEVNPSRAGRPRWAWGPSLTFGVGVLSGAPLHPAAGQFPLDMGFIRSISMTRRPPCRSPLDLV